MLFDLPSKAVIILCKRDLDQAQDLADMWAKAGNSRTDLAQVSTDGALVRGVEAFLPMGIPTGHPQAVNAAFRYLIDEAAGSFNFLFLEPDVAIHPARGSELLEKMEAQLRYRGGRILGAPIHVPGHGWTHNGVAFYAHNIRDYLDWEGHSMSDPFDDWISSQIYPKLLSPTGLIQHTPVQKGVTEQHTLACFGKAPIFHGSKDRSLADLCLGRASDTVQA